MAPLKNVSLLLENGGQVDPEDVWMPEAHLAGVTGLWGQADLQVDALICNKGHQDFLWDVWCCLLTMLWGGSAASQGQ